MNTYFEQGIVINASDRSLNYSSASLLTYGDFRINSTTDSTDLNTASLIDLGGLSVSKNALFGQNLTVYGNEVLIGGLTDTQINSNFGFTGGSLYITGPSNLLGGLTTSTLMASGLTTGSLTVTGSSTFQQGMTLGSLYVTGPSNLLGGLTSTSIIANNGFTGGSMYITGGSDLNGLTFTDCSGTNLLITNFSTSNLICSNLTGNNLVLVSCTMAYINVTQDLKAESIKASDKCQFNGDFTIPSTANTYSKTTSTLYVNGDTILEGDLGFTLSQQLPPTMNGRTSGTRIILYPQTGITQGDYSIGVENNYKWFQVPSNNQGYKFYYGTDANIVFSTSGNVGIMTTNPSFVLDVVGSIKGDIYTGGSIHLSGISSIANLVVTNISSGTVNASNLLSTNISTSTLNSSLGFTGGRLYITGTSIINGGSTLGSLYVTGSSNLIGGLTTSSIMSNVGFTGGSLYISGPSNLVNLISTNISTSAINASFATIPNIVNTNISTTTINANSTTFANLFSTNLINTNATFGNSIINNLINTNATFGNSIINNLINTNATFGNSIINNLINTNATFGNSIINNLTAGYINAIYDTTLNNTICDLVTMGGLTVTGSSRLLGQVVSDIGYTGGGLYISGGAFIQLGITTGSFRVNGTEYVNSSIITNANIVNLTVGGINIRPSICDFNERSATYANNLLQNVLNFTFSVSNCRFFKAIASATCIRAGGNKMGGWDLTGINSNGVFTLTSTLYGTNIGSWSIIGSTGQLRFTSTNETGFSFGTIKFRANTLTI